MKKIFFLSCLIAFVFSYIPASFAQEDFFGDEDFTEGFEDDTGGGGFSGDTLDTLIDDLDSIREDLLDELEDSPSKPLKAVTKKLGKCVDLIEGALDASDEGEIEDCGSDLEKAHGLLEKIVDLFEARECKSERASRKCISQDVVEAYLEDLEDMLDSLDEEINLDDDEDGIPDICGFSEDFE